MNGDPQEPHDVDVAPPDCGQPCDPDHSCEYCEPYWQRMQAEGLFDRERHRWTEAGWREILRHC